MRVSPEKIALYKKVDDVLWYDWDPIGVNDSAPRNEYRSYVPEIFSMLTQNKSAIEIADRLYKIKTVTIGVLGNRKRCLKIAEMLINHKNRG